MSDSDEFDPEYDGVWSQRRDPLSIPFDSRLDDPDDEKGPLYEQCVLTAFNNGVNSLLRELRSGDLQVFSNQDLVSLSKMYKRSWSRFVDPRYSHPANSGNSARIVLWECDQHYVTLFSVKGKWDVSYRARLVEDNSIISDSELINDDDSDFVDDIDTSWIDDDIEDRDPVSAFDLQEDQERRELLDQDLAQLIMLGFEKQEILETFNSSSERLDFFNLFKTSAKTLEVEVSELADELTEYDLPAIRKILELGHFLGGEFRGRWLKSVLTNFDTFNKKLLVIEDEIFPLLGFSEPQIPDIFEDAAERSVFFNHLITHLKAAEKAGFTSPPITLQYCLHGFGRIGLLDFKKWIEIGVRGHPKIGTDWYVLGQKHPLISGFTDSGETLEFAIHGLHQIYFSK